MIPRFIAAIALVSITAVAQTAAPGKPKATNDVSKLDPAMGTNKKAAVNLDWHDVTKWGVEGRGWADQERKRWFDRFPAKAEGKVTPAVWSLSRDSAGMMVRFKTDATAIHARYKLAKSNIGMPHMPPTGVSGLDLYARDTDGKWKWVQVTKPNAQTVEQQIIAGLAPGEREYAAYLPLYNGIESLEIGVPKGAKFEGLAPRAKPIVFYGTSITHGACASRPGMVHTAILGRRLDMPVINCGFSGNGKMDAAVGDLLIELDAAAYGDRLPAKHGSRRCDGEMRAVRETTPRGQARHADHPCRRPPLLEQLDHARQVQVPHREPRSSQESV